jgi:O-antigen ligase
MMSPVNFDAFDLPKAVFLYLLALTLLTGYIGRSLFGGEIVIKKTALNKPLFAFALVSTIAVIASPVPLVSIVGEYARYENLPTLLSYALIAFMAAQFINTKEWVNKLIVASFISFGLIVFYGIAQNLGLDILPQFMREFEGRSRSTLGNPVFFGGYIAMMSPLLLHYLLSDEELPGMPKSVITSLLIMGFAGAVFSQSRGAWLAIVIGFIAVMLLNREKALRAAGNVTTVVIVGLALVLILISAGGQQQAAKQFNDIKERAVSATSLSTGTTASRIEIWKSSLKMISVRPLTGYGPDQMYLWSPAFKTLKKAQIEKNTIPDRTHNEFLQNAVNSGLLGLLAFLWIASAIVLMSIRTAKGAGGLRGPSLGIAAALTGYIAQGLSGVAVIGLTAPALIFGGVIAAIAAGREAERSVWSLGIKRDVEVFAVVLVAACAAAIFTFKPMVADAYYLNGVTNSASKYQNQAIASLGRAVSLNPYQAQYRRDLAIGIIEQGKAAENPSIVVDGISLLEDGLRKNPHDVDLILATATAYRVYASLASDMALVAQSENYYSLAVQKNPLSTNPRRGLIGLLMPQEKYDQVIEHALVVLQIDPNDDEVKYRLAEAYQKTGRGGRSKKIFKELLAKYPDRTDIKAALSNFEPVKPTE